jgi:hypothetical protein
MKFPRRLAKTADGRYCEETDPEAAFFVGTAGREISDLEAEREGIAEYFRQTSAPAEVKMVEQSTVEDKAVAGPSEVKAEEAPAQPPARGRRAVDFPPETTR